MNLSQQEIGMGLIIATCTCCGNVHKAQKMQNACSYSLRPNYGCNACQGIPPRQSQRDQMSGLIGMSDGKDEERYQEQFLGGGDTIK